MATRLFSVPHPAARTTRTSAFARLCERLTVGELASIVAAVVGAFWFVLRLGIVSALMA